MEVIVVDVDFWDVGGRDYFGVLDVEDIFFEWRIEEIIDVFWGGVYFFLFVFGIVYFVCVWLVVVL